METQTFRIFKIVLIPLLIAAVLVVYFNIQTTPRYEMRADFFDVGQGDSFLITSLEGNQMLVDGGPGNSVLEGLGQVMPFFDKDIELMVVTHPHLDHFEGLISVLARYQVKKVLMPNVEYSSAQYEKFMQAVAEEQSEIIWAVQGQRVWLDKSTVLDVFHPLNQEHIVPKKNDDVNDYSVVARVMMGKTKLLLTGDAGIDVENVLLPDFDLDADLLKVGHHGSKHSSGQEFIDEVTPEFAVIQVGENKYGHPTPEVVDRLKNSGAVVYTTDGGKIISFVSDGQVLRYVTSGQSWWRQLTNQLLKSGLDK